MYMYTYSINKCGYYCTLAHMSCICSIAVYRTKVVANLNALRWQLFAGTFFCGFRILCILLVSNFAIASHPRPPAHVERRWLTSTRLFLFVLREHIRSYMKGILWDLPSLPYTTTWRCCHKSLHVCNNVRMGLYLRACVAPIQSFTSIKFCILVQIRRNIKL